jgi:hypothetical protein
MFAGDCSSRTTQWRTSVHGKGFDSRTRACTQWLDAKVDWRAAIAALRGVGYHDVTTAELQEPDTDPRAAVRATNTDMARTFAP